MTRMSELRVTPLSLAYIVYEQAPHDYEGRLREPEPVHMRAELRAATAQLWDDFDDTECAHCAMGVGYVLTEDPDTGHDVSTFNPVALVLGYSNDTVELRVEESPKAVGIFRPMTVHRLCEDCVGVVELVFGMDR